MVPADRAGHAGGNAHHRQGVIHGKHTLHNGNEHPKGSPAGPCGKSQQATDEEHNSRQEHLDLGGVAVNKVPDKILRAQRIRHRLQRPGKTENEDSGDHGLESLWNAGHHTAKRHGAAEPKVNQGEDQCKGRPQQQPHRGIRRRKCLHKPHTIKKSAGIEHPGDTAENQQNDGQNQVHDPSVAHILFHLHGVIRILSRKQIPRLHRVALIPRHRAIVDFQQGNSHHHQNGQQCVKVKRDGPDKQIQPLAVLRKSRHRRSPGRNGGNDTHRSGRSINEIGQLCPGNPMLVRHRTHDAAHGQAVKVVINEDQAAQNNRGQLGAYPGLDMGLRPPAKGG